MVSAEARSKLLSRFGGGDFGDLSEPFKGAAGIIISTSCLMITPFAEGHTRSRVHDA